MMNTIIMDKMITFKELEIKIFEYIFSYDTLTQEIELYL